MALTLQTRRIALIVGLAAVAATIWWARSRSEAPSPEASPVAGAASSAAPAPLSASQVEHGISEALDAVQRTPTDAAAWAMLAHSYEMQGRFTDAGESYRKLLALRPDDAQVHADTADALGVAAQGSLQGEPARLIARALQLDPANLKALVLGGKEAFERRRYDEAVALWERALKATSDEKMLKPIETSIAEARALKSPASAAAAASQPFITGRVTLAASLLAKAAPEDVLFIYARPVEGSRMPVALLRKHVRDLPLDFALDDSLSMVPQARLSQHQKVLVGARISRRGDAIPAAGDLEGEISGVALGAQGIRIEIDRARP